MVIESSSVLILYDEDHHLLDPQEFDCLQGVDTIMSIDEAGHSLDQLVGEFSLVLADLAQARPEQQTAFLDLINKLAVKHASFVILHKNGEVSNIFPEVLERTDVLIPHPVSNSHLSKVMEQCWQHFHHREALRKDLNAIMGAFKSMDRGRFPFQSLPEAKSLSMLLSIMCPNSNDAAVGLLELMVNGIEHGNLEISYDEKGLLLGEGRWHEEIEYRLSNPAYSDRYAMIEFERNKDRIEFLISDEGPGFDVTKYLTEKEQETSSGFSQFHGRGIKLAKQICFDQLEYLGRGNQVKATIQL